MCHISDTFLKLTNKISWKITSVTNRSNSIGLCYHLLTLSWSLNLSNTIYLSNSIDNIQPIITWFTHSTKLPQMFFNQEFDVISMTLSGKCPWPKKGRLSKIFRFLSFSSRCRTSTSRTSVSSSRSTAGLSPDIDDAWDWCRSPWVDALLSLWLAAK